MMTFFLATWSACSRWSFGEGGSLFPGPGRTQHARATGTFGPELLVLVYLVLVPRLIPVPGMARKVLLIFYIGTLVT